ncbi:MAG: hypothetical protein A2381_03400 [Bdellovibrionales bacterium RIFOXYB1_FULL_37_110]|nr:MAG: hypothetical protein A2181_00505 [Bdellovibrionales bacterium RIFOXYA1_FULL_38_20]OFZ48451.1 MAG: hypothetical protein A2417_03890 [Bdellovibrionales bacterium RIFOXYC1_FULL_37_79]OFZ57972.1 MAG: hypothetical protein A2381_03400 [Bdellovibrionales bacterium RIFOXYB1_FULL_37_110]OFZ63109.1 MAG: hypothetical protein A2577_15530 [Bdellovibrionales bacterium RIFOXYD1_FULL_36_51]
MKNLFFILTFLLISSTQAQINIITSIEPVTFLVEEIGKNLVATTTLIGQGKDPHTYTPSPEQIKKISTAQFYFAIGAQFESIILNKINSQKGLSIIMLDQNFKKRKMESSHDHGDKQGHNENEFDPHIWLSPIAINNMAEIIASTLSKHDPNNQPTYQKNLVNFKSQFNQTITVTNQLLAPLKGKKVFVFHPAFGYFLNAFDLLQEAIELEGKSPSPKHIAHIIKQAKEDKTKVIFVSPQFSTKAAQTIADGIKGEVVSINPLEKNVLKNFIDMANAIKKAYE